MRAKEFAPRKLVIFDIDDTLVHTQTKVHVIKDGRVVKELNSHEFTHYKLQPGEQFDFENFRNAHDFFHNSKPIIPMLNQLKQDIATGNKVVMVTARADFDDRELFLDTFRKYGINMNKVHVYRAGNMTQKIQTEEKKKIIIRNLLNKEHYTKAIMYDDAVPNLESFVELKKEYPHTKFYAWHVSLDGEASEYHRTDENMDHSKDDQAVPELKAALLGHKAEIQSADDDKVYDIIDKMMTRIAKAHGISGQKLHDMWVKKYGQIPDTWIMKIEENFADGRNPQDKGDSKRYGINTKASVSSLRKTAKQGGRKGQLAHWLANMKAGRAKKK
jgi:FMN phosphatase YigB (HAD superfamily)